MLNLTPKLRRRSNSYLLSAKISLTLCAQFWQQPFFTLKQTNKLWAKSSDTFQWIFHTIYAAFRIMFIILVTWRSQKLRFGQVGVNDALKVLRQQKKVFEAIHLSPILNFLYLHLVHGGGSGRNGEQVMCLALEFPVFGMGYNGGITFYGWFIQCFQSGWWGPSVTCIWNLTPLFHESLYTLQDGNNWRLRKHLTEQMTFRTVIGVIICKRWPAADKIILLGYTVVDEDGELELDIQ